MTVYIISGISSGLGYALVEYTLKACTKETIVIGLSRSTPDFLNRFPNRFEWVKTDLKNLGEVIKDLEFSIKKYSPTEIIFISNAGDINPIAKIGVISSQEMIDSLLVNIVYPSSIIHFLMNKYSLVEKLFIINISTGAINKVIQGWSLYSSSKAYMKMYFDVLAAELAGEMDGRIIIKQFDPGAMDTYMQFEARNASVSSEQQDKLKKLYEMGNLKQPKEVAELIIRSIRKL